MAQTNLGVCYAKGEGATKDEIEAYAYWELAGMTIEVARKNLAILEKKMSQDARLLGQKRTKELQKEIEAKKAAKAGGK
jgi:TPR repeat protein